MLYHHSKFNTKYKLFKSALRNLSNNFFAENAENFFNSAVILQFCDCISSVIISNKLQKTTSMVHKYLKLINNIKYGLKVDFY